MTVYLGVLFIALSGRPASTSCTMTAQLAGPSHVEAGKAFVLRVTITNNGPEGCQFVRYWKWASNRMFLEIHDGPRVTSSEPLLLDIDKSYQCFYAKPLGPRDTYSFEVRVNSGFGSVELPLETKGAVHVRWRYVGDSSARTICPVAGIDTWIDDLTSNELTVVVDSESQKARMPPK